MPTRDAPMPGAAHASRIDVPQIRHPEDETPAWWFRMGAAQAAERGAMSGKAKNVILFVGDGMSLTTVAAARILEGQRRGQSGEENALSWERFPHTALSKTYNTDSQTPDSAGTMSAMATGVKTRSGVLSIGQQPLRGDCKGALGAQLLTLWELAASTGMATGVVTTTRITHATPAATFSHSAHRNWENDTELPADAVEAGCIDIPRQMIETPYGKGPIVLMGGGRENLLPVGLEDPEYSDKVGLRLDERNLVDAWKQRHPTGVYVWNHEQMRQAPADTPLLGLFEPGHMQYEHDRIRDRASEPPLAEMVRTAIQRLEANANDQGYVLLVEGGRIDHAHHSGNAHRALIDTIALSDAVRAATEATSEQDTLILVTADHSHTLTFAGYPVRGNPILGKVKGSSGEGNAIGPYATDATGLPYTTLSYANGPGYVGATDQQPEGPKTLNYEISGFQTAERGRPDLNEVDTDAPDYLQEAMIPLGYETHGGDDVGIWARGPGAHAVRGSLEQNAIFHILLQATPRLRQRLCAANLCNADGVPVELPDPAQFR
ncbi:MAG: alkaline phosphatase [Lysobacteraceae bacterium]|nr:MAG: alkaline phosphatase [Xanthomonadaceae bacterium]